MIRRIVTLDLFPNTSNVGKREDSTGLRKTHLSSNSHVKSKFIELTLKTIYMIETPKSRQWSEA